MILSRQRILDMWRVDFYPEGSRLQNSSWMEASQRIIMADSVTEVEALVSLVSIVSGNK